MWRFIDFIIDLICDLRICIKNMFRHRPKTFEIHNVKYFWENMHGNGTYGG